MNPSDPLSTLWNQQSQAPVPPLQQIVRKAQNWSKRERREIQFATVALLSTVIFFLFQAYLMRAESAMMILLLGLAVFLTLATLRMRRYARKLKVPTDLDTQQYLLALQEQRTANKTMERFIYFVYMPLLASGVCAGLWLALAPLEEAWIRWAAIGATLVWVVIAGFWGRTRQNKKRQRLDELISQLQEKRGS